MNIKRIKELAEAHEKVSNVLTDIQDEEGVQISDQSFKDFSYGDELVINAISVSLHKVQEDIKQRMQSELSGS